MVTIENEFLRVSIRAKGAEMTSIFNKATGVEHLWQAAANIWGWHAPNLFPVVGGCINDEIQIDGKSYPMNRHGFARTSIFTLVDSTETHAKFSLKHSEETLSVYPYKFAFQVLYDLFDSELRVSYKVINYDEGTIYFSVGAHPAFNVPFYKDEAYEDYVLEFEEEEELEKHLLSEKGLFNGTTESVTMEAKQLALTADLFAKDALVFKNLSSQSITIKSKNHNHSLKVHYPQFNYMGIWAKCGAPFVCIEPWLGCADSIDKITELRDKEAIHALEHGHVFEVDFSIVVN